MISTGEVTANGPPT